MGEIKVIEIKEEILTDNNQTAQELRERLKREKTFLPENPAKRKITPKIIISYASGK